MAEWHFYATGPQTDNPKKQWTTGTDEEKKLLTDRFDHALAWSNAHHIPTWVGAWMSSDFNKVNSDKRASDGAPAGGSYSLAEQIHFSSFVSQELYKRHIPFAINSDTKYYDREKNEWHGSRKAVLDAILAPWK